LAWSARGSWFTATGLQPDRIKGQSRFLETGFGGNPQKCVQWYTKIAAPALLDLEPQALVMQIPLSESQFHVI
jgi:hypothetical protein